MTSPLQAVQAALAADRAQADPALWITRVPDDAMLAQAEALEREGPRDRPLWGMVCAVKDNIDVAGLPTTAACPAYAYTPSASAVAVQRLLDAGALVLGKTNLDQFATGLVGTRSPYGVPRNLFDPALVPGGSSSGSGCAVAAGIVPFALGTDTAGSGRVPAAFGNIVGLKPTLGSVSTRGVVPACRSLDTISVFARTVDAALAVQRVIAGFDPEDRYARPAPWPHLRRGAIPVTARIAMADPDPLCDSTTAALVQRAGARLHAETVDLTQFLEAARLLYDGPWVAERTAALWPTVGHRPEILHPVTRAILQAGLDRRTVDAFDAFHCVAAARRAAEHLFQHYDALLLPTAPFCPSLAAVADDPIGVNSRLGAFTNFVNLCDLAGYAVPIGLGDDGIPVGATLLGPAWSEGRLAAIADALHRAFTETAGATGLALPAAAEPDALMPGETGLFCIGAHMGGLKLNSQVAALGGRFLRSTRTVPQYRLHALGDRPGLLRGEPGAAIEGEVWALPTEAIGPLLAQVGPPLGFGSVALQDGPCLGFLAEAAGVAGAPDITRFGGWRAWLKAQATEAA